MKFNYKGVDIPQENLRNLLGERDFNSIVKNSLMTETTTFFITVCVGKRKYDMGKLIVTNQHMSEYEEYDDFVFDKNKIIFSPLVAKRYLGTVVWFFDTFNGVGLTRGVLRIIDEEAVYPYSSGDMVFHRFIIPDSPMMRKKSRLLDEHELNALVGKIVTHNETGDNYIISHFIDGKTPKVYISGLGGYDSEMLAEQFNINGKPIRRED